MKKNNYAWIICAACVLLIICNMGLCGNIFVIYLPFLKTAGFTGSQGSSIISVRCFFSFLCMFFVTKYYNRFSLRTGIALASLAGVLGFVVFSLGKSIAVYYLGAALAGFAYGLGAMIPMAILIRNWFTEKRGLAIGICSAGSGLTTVIFSPIIERIITAYSLPIAFLFQAAFMLLSGLLVFVIIRDHPDEKGLLPYGAGKAATETGSASGLSANAIPVPVWILLAGMAFLVGGAGQTVTTHISILAVSLGYSTRLAARMASLFGLLLVVGKFVFGDFSDRLGTKLASTVFFLIYILGFLPVLWMNGANSIPCYLCAGLLGLGGPICAAGIPLWAADFSTSETYAEAQRRLQLFYMLGGILISPIPGKVADMTGEYRTAFLSFAFSSAFSLLLLLIAYRQVRRQPGHS